MKLSRSSVVLAVVGVLLIVAAAVVRFVVVPSVLSSGLYAVPALVGATVVVVADVLDARGPVAAVTGAAVCFAVRMLGVHYDINAPFPPAVRRHDDRGGNGPVRP